MSSRNTRRFMAVPEPRLDLKSVKAVLEAVKHNLDLLTGQIGGDDIETKVKLVSKQTEGVVAKYNETVKIVTTEVSALVEKIEEIEAAVDGGTAGGKIGFRASAGPEGYDASYDLVVTAQATGGAPIETGFSVIARVDGDDLVTESSITFRAADFRLIDPSDDGRPRPVFEYSAGKFTFLVPVEVRTGDLKSRAATDSRYARNDDIIGGGSVSVSVVVKDDDTIVDLVGEFDGAPTASYPFALPTQSLILVRQDPDDDEVEIQSKLLSFYVSGNTESLAKNYTYTAMIARDTPPSAGTYIYTIYTTTDYGPVSLRALSSYR